MTKRTNWLYGELGNFIRKYSRKAQRGTEPNDRNYDRDLESQIKSMAPQELSELLSGAADGIDQGLEERWFNGESIQGVSFCLGDSVVVNAGARKGRRGEVLALLAIVPDKKYYIELDGGESLVALQSQLEKA